MRKTFTTMAMVAALALIATAALAHHNEDHVGGPGTPTSPEPEPTFNVVTGATEDHGPASDNYASAEVVDTVSLTEGDWQITGSGALQTDAGGTAPNCGLRTGDDESGFTLIAKQQVREGAFGGTTGFSVVGAALEVEDELDVDLVCYGEGINVFEHNLVAVGG